MRTTNALILLCTSSLLLLGGCRNRGGPTANGTGATTINDIDTTIPPDQDIMLPEEATPPVAPETQSGLTLLQEADKQEVYPGDRIGYTLTLRNPGTVPAYNLDLEDAFPAGKLVILESRGGTVAEDRVTWMIDELDAGETRVIRVEAEVGKDLENDTILNIVTLRGGGLPVTTTTDVKVMGRLPQAGVEYTKPLEDTSKFVRRRD
ncbi:MAG: hypothetical protein Greene041619_844 [Candidatus Peregrinibacteria bacterium Greene0416_19]|nr:MAG: hypothetical protein Greene041619_844 [Candidatus Peregrinibacteria bacterium Greene0416_19]